MLNDEQDDEDDFLSIVGSSLESKALLINALKMCDNNEVVTVGDLTVIEIHRACQNLKLKRTDDDDGSKAQLFCEQCGMICPIMIPDHETIFGLTEKKNDDDSESEELDEFLDRAGSLVTENLVMNDDQSTTMVEDPYED